MRRTGERDNTPVKAISMVQTARNITDTGNETTLNTGTRSSQQPQRQRNRC